MPVNPDGHAGLLASVTKVFHQKFSPGLVGTQSRVVCMGILAFIFIVCFLNGLPVAMFGMALILIAALGGFVVYQSHVAIKNPHLAITEGNEYRKIVTMMLEMAGSGVPVIPPTIAIDAPPSPLQSQPSDEGIAP